MAKVGLFYDSDTGNTRKVAKRSRVRRWIGDFVRKAGATRRWIS